MTKSARSSHKPISAMPTYRVEVETTEGLEGITQDELLRYGLARSPDIQTTAGALSFPYTGTLPRLLRLQTVGSVYLVLDFPVPRPRALLGHEHFHRLLEGIKTVRALSSTTAYSTLYISAAGAESSVMMRLKSEIAAHSGLTPTASEGDLLLRVRRAGEGWQVLIRLTPRPLATRHWRVCNFEGALNGPTAHAMIRLLNPQPEDVFVNLACGSGTLLIERAAAGTAKAIYGVDVDRETLACASANINAASQHVQISLLQADATTLPFSRGSVNTLAADLPFGQHVGSHQDNLKLYPALLSEAARVAAPEARFVLITHEIRLIEQLLAKSALWRTERAYKINLRGLHPRVYLLTRTSE